MDNEPDNEKRELSPTAIAGEFLDTWAGRLTTTGITVGSSFMAGMNIPPTNEMEAIMAISWGITAAASAVSTALSGARGLK